MKIKWDCTQHAFDLFIGAVVWVAAIGMLFFGAGSVAVFGIKYIIWLWGVS